MTLPTFRLSAVLLCVLGVVFLLTAEPAEAFIKKYDPSKTHCGGNNQKVCKKTEQLRGCDPGFHRTSPVGGKCTRENKLKPIIDKVKPKKAYEPSATHCGGNNQKVCKKTEQLRGCDPGYHRTSPVGGICTTENKLDPIIDKVKPKKMFEPSQTHCGGNNQKVCKKTEQLRGCDPGFHRTSPVGGICTTENKLKPKKMYEPSATHCGGNNQKVCKKTEQLRGCDPGFHRTSPVGGKCTTENKLKPKKFYEPSATHCGGNNQKVCKKTEQLRGCDPGFHRTSPVGGKCTTENKLKLKKMYEPSETDCGGLNQRVCKKSEQLRGCDPDLHRTSPMGGTCTHDNKLIPDFIENNGEWSPPKWVQRLFKKNKKDNAIEILKANQDNIDGMKNVVSNLQRKHGALTNADAIRSLTAQDLIDAGASDVLKSACGNNFLCTITITAGADASYVVGGSGSGGIAFGTVHEKGDAGAKDIKITYILTTNVTGGASVGASGNIEIGFWKSRFNEMEGFAHGLQVGGSVSGVGAGGSVWWNINWFWENEDWSLFDWNTWRSEESKDEYGGIVVGYQGGLEFEVEYAWGYTWNWGEGVEFLLKSRTKSCLQFENPDRVGSRAEMWGCHRGSKSQLWQQVDESLVNIKGLCLTANELRKGSRLSAQECDGSPEQKWRKDKRAFKVGNLCLDVRRSEIGQDGGTALLWTCHGEKNQQWRKDLR